MGADGEGVLKFEGVRRMAAGVALVAGASGLVGTALVDELLEQPAWTRVIALVRRPLGRSHARLVEHVTDWKALGSSTPLPKADAAFCCLGTTMRSAGSKDAFRAVDLDAVLRFALAAQAGGTRRLFLVSARGAKPTSLIFYNRVKAEAEEALRALHLDALGVARPSLLLGNRAEVRRGERAAVILSHALRPLLQHLAARPIEARTVARALVAMAERQLEAYRIYENPQLHAMGA